MGLAHPRDDTAVVTARALMAEFAQCTGLEDEHEPPVRYLWTDAFAVCNFIELFYRTGDEHFRRQALLLVAQVHTVLGRHRADDSRSGWISGLANEIAAQHPTAGGLRIGKPRNERAANEPENSTLEWDRDGQYFHYLTKWMHALNQVTWMTGDERYLLQALELAKVAHSGFSYTSSGFAAPRIHWKMSIDLSRPLVAAMGHHDPLDALMSYRELQATSRHFTGERVFPDLSNELDDAQAMCAGQDWTTNDSLGIGGLLFDALREAQLCVADTSVDGGFLEALLRDADSGLQVFLHTSTVSEAADRRLAFRELGLSIGLHALARLRVLLDENWQRFRNGAELVRLIGEMQRFQRLRPAIERFWLDPANRQSASWINHRDINTVMLASAMMPDGFLRMGQRVEPSVC